MESCAFEGESLCGCIFDLRSEGDACIISAHMSFGSSGLSRGGAQRYKQLIGCESALRRLNHFAEILRAEFLDGWLEEFICYATFQVPFERFSLFSSFRSGVRSSKEYSRYRSNINYVRNKQVNNPESFNPVQSFRGGAKFRVASERAAQRSSRREQLGHTTGVGLQPLS